MRNMVREIKKEEIKKMNRVARHPLQSYEWGEFRSSERVGVVRLGEYKKGELTEVYQISLHEVPGLPWKIGYCPKTGVPSKEVMKKVKVLAKKERVVMIKFEPGLRKGEEKEKFRRWRKENRLVKGEPLFTKHTFWLNLEKSEEELLAGMKSKTRYNIRLAKRKGVEIVEDSSDKGFETYWKLMKETTDRQEFYAHGKDYHQKMWQIMSKSGQAHLFKAVFEKEVLTTWVVFKLNETLYYPYGASSRKRREMMASNLMMWEMILFGKREGCKKFDMWGSLGPKASQKDPWYGFHKFKEGYGGDLIEFVGSWDLVISPLFYLLYRGGNKLRWVFLRLKKKLPF